MADADNGDGKEDELPMTDIENPRDTDVLCGRGGAALRHPGNQTYRRLVHLNKGLYITCLKAEKLKISRSIVAAIREQSGRFLERDTKKGTWYDIGDKKAMEKTSQALREGQPKLRQKIVELGGGAAGAAALLESQFPGGSMFAMGQGAAAALDQSQQQQQQEQQFSMPDQNSMHHPPHHRDHLSTDMMHRLSLTETTIAEEPAFQQHFRPSLTQRGSGVGGELGIDQSTLSLMSDMSSYGMAESILSIDSNNLRNSILSHAGSDRIPPAPPLMAPGSMTPNSLASGESKKSFGNMDRRKYFARMKYSRPASGRLGSGSTKPVASSQRSLGTGGDSMPDIHLVESSPSLNSNVSSVSERKLREVADLEEMTSRGRVPDVANVFESRRSLMSGLSRISDTSEVNSIFSDLSKKIGNVSTRSIAMSEISNMDEVDHDSVDTDRLPTTVASMASHSMEE